MATPIGNREDISARAIEVLRNVDRIYAEDTQHSVPLLRHHGIDTRVVTIHEHNEHAMVDAVLSFLKNAHNAALISDAGTPLISDPGFRLVRACQRAGVLVSPVPGACALVSALSVSGLPTDRFQFVGFAPHRSAARKSWLRPLAAFAHTQVLYESPHRIVDSLTDIVDIFGATREICLARELTKRFETVISGQAADVLEQVILDANQQRGEFVIVIAGQSTENDASSASEIELDRVLHVLLEHLPVNKAAKAAADIFALKKRDVYERALKLQGR